jgi:hydrogenase nickel incorporation protein HypB
MCDACGCAGSSDEFHVSDAFVRRVPFKRVEVQEALLADNDRVAAHNRSHFDAAGTLVVNLMSSPGAGKTSLLEATIRALQGRLTIAVIEALGGGDAARLRLRTRGDGAPVAAGMPPVRPRLHAAHAGWPVHGV